MGSPRVITNAASIILVIFVISSWSCRSCVCRIDGVRSTTGQQLQSRKAITQQPSESSELIMQESGSGIKERRGLVVTSAVGTATRTDVTTGRELAAAMLNPTVGLIRVTVPFINASLNDFNSVVQMEPPLVITRNVTVEGDQTLADWPTVDLGGLKGLLRLADGVALTFRRLYGLNVRKQPTRAPGTDILQATLPGQTSFLFADQIAMIFDLCFPSTTQGADYSLLKRPEQYFPGNNSFDFDVPQPGCINDTGASTSITQLQRCWASKLAFYDFAVVGADYNEVSDVTTPNNYYSSFKNSYILCKNLVGTACLVSGKAPLLCYREAEQQLQLTTSPAPAAAPSEPLGSRSNSTQQTEGDKGLTGAGLIAVISVSSVGGLVILVGVAWLLVRSVRQRRQEQKNQMDSPITMKMMNAAADLPPSSMGSGGKRYRDSPTYTAGTSSSQPRVTASTDMARSGTSSEAGAILQQRWRDRPPGDLPVTPLTPPRPSVLLQVRVLEEAEQDAAAGQDSHAAGVPHAAQAEGPGEFGIVTDKSGDGGRGPADDGTAAGGDVQNAGDPASSPVASMAPLVKLLPVVRGKGAFGRVVEGLFEGRPVAVKLLVAEAFLGLGAIPAAGQGTNTLQTTAKTFLQEVEVLSRVKHPNIVQLLAASVTPPRFCLVMELMETSLDKLLHGNPNDPIVPLSKVLYICMCIANALAYLHPTIVHRDLKPANVLINNPADDRPIVKLTDFGLSRLRATAAASTKHPDAGTVAYMAPECFDVDNNKVFHKSDIYSLGVLMWELLSRKRPWDGIEPVQIAFMVAYKNFRPPMKALDPQRCPPIVAKLVTSCWDEDMDRRPAAAELVKELAVLHEKLERGQNLGSIAVQVSAPLTQVADEG